jgi:hypothetical protein
VVVAIHAPNAFTKAALLTAAALLLIGWLIASRRRLLDLRLDGQQAPRIQRRFLSATSASQGWSSLPPSAGRASPVGDIVRRSAGEHRYRRPYSRNVGTAGRIVAGQDGRQRPSWCAIRAERRSRLSAARAEQCDRRRADGFSQPHPINTLSDRHFGVLAVAEVTAENSGAAMPPHLVAGAPAGRDPNGDRRGAPRIALTRFAREAAGCDHSSGIPVRRNPTSRVFSRSITNCGEGLPNCEIL